MKGEWYTCHCRLLTSRTVWSCASSDSLPLSNCLQREKKSCRIGSWTGGKGGREGGR